MTFARNTKISLFVATLLMVGMTALGLLFHRGSAHPTRDSQATKGQGLGFQVGHSYRYLLRYDTMQQAAAGFGSEEGLGGAMQLEADLTLYVHDVREGQFFLSAMLDTLKHAKLKLAEQFLWKDAADALATFSGRRIFFKVDRAGRVLSIVTPSGEEADTKLFAHTMRTLLTELQFELSPDGAREYVREESTLYGRVESHYSQEGALAFRRTREKALFLRAASLGTGDVSHKLAAQHQFQLDAQRVPEHIEGSEELTVCADGKDLQRVSTRLALTKRKQERFNLLELAFLSGPETALDAWSTSDAAERDHLEQRIDGLTMDQLLETVLAMGAGAERTDQARFLWRATGLLIRDPALCMRLVPLAAHDKATRELRAFALDLLTGVSDAAATRAMLAILTSPSVRRDEAYPLYLQRLGTQTVPTDEAFELVNGVFESAQREGKRDELYAAAYTLGAMAQETGPGSAQETRALNVLRHSLAEQREPSSIAHYVRALGNVGRDSVLADVSRLRGHTDAEVRTAVATALGAIPSGAAQRDLLELVGDGVPSVQREAIVALYRRKVGPEALSELQRSIQSGVAQANVPYLLDVLKRLRKDDPRGVSQTLDVLIATGSLTREQRSLVDALRDG